ncbi:MAG TPA: aminotransferase class I/II-fold pyridoxal phosphate-dependent enzyme [Clostridia bacterium]|nr:aminotransferase class I/II-fold pyridoxal phosphate-dependent enzyme [Clostridia bacterium]
MVLSALGKNELKQMLSELITRYEGLKSQNLNLDMSRGRPCTEQLNLSDPMMENLFRDYGFKSESGTDCRNYGLIDGIPEAKRLFAELLGVSENEIILGGNSSLNMMYDAIARAMSFGVYGSREPWGRKPIKFLCPSPGYDRHFAITELFGIEMITVKMNPDGPDMDTVERLSAEDESIKGIWCVPKYSNPDGITYSDTVVRRFAAMKTKAPDFRIFWDNAYVVHHLTDEPDELLNIMDECKKAGNPDRVFIFSSTSKITYPGAGIAMLAASQNNIQLIKKQLSIQTIGPDKINQLRHTLFLKSVQGIKEHMKKHAAILKPKFDTVLGILESELGGKGIAEWNSPKGGYFISLNTLPGCATAAVKMAKEAGVVITPAGATYPYGHDPEDRNIRLAPTLPPIDELKKAMELFTVCVQIVSIKKLLGELNR